MYVDSYLKAIGGIQFSDSVNTAGVTQDGLFVNPTFYDSLDDFEKQFLITHEVLHLLFKHHSRFECNQSTNIATDLAINSILLDMFQCKPEDMPVLGKIMVYPAKFGLPDGKTTEWYINALKSNLMPVPLNMLSHLNTGAKNLEDLLDCSLFQEEVQKELAPKQNFLSLVKSLLGNTTAYSGYDKIEKWGFNRKWSILPGERWSEGDTKIRKNNVVLFLDYSGSCIPLRPKFEQARSEIPKQYFNVNHFRFADRISADTNHIGSGTNFHGLPEVASRYQADMIWVFTDGYGTKLSIDCPNKWHWFLSEFNTISYIPQGCNIHFLK